jgi:uncharacterized protein CbrC (UPF0167 family)
MLCLLQSKRGYIYTGPVYSLEDLDDALCPWCIADGSAAAKFDADFCSPLALYNDKVAKSIIDEVQYRTPSYMSRQDCNWAAHCEDACEYHGLADAKYLKGLNEEQKNFLLQELGWDEGMWDQLIENIPTDESVVDDPEIHLFLCRHCKKELYDIAYS